MKHSLLTLFGLLFLFSCIAIKKDKGNCGGEVRSDLKREKFLNALFFDLIIDTRLDSIALAEEKALNIKRDAQAELEEKRYLDSIVALKTQKGDTSLLIIHPRPRDVYALNVTVYPEFKGGSSAFEDFVRKQIFVCAFFLKMKQGNISETKFAVEADGSISIIGSAGGQRQDFDREIETVLKKSSRLWMPARIGGISKRTEMTLKLRLKK